MTQIVWVCQNWDRRWITADSNFSPEKHLFKGWEHTGRCGFYEMWPVEHGPEAA